MEGFFRGKGFLCSEVVRLLQAVQQLLRLLGRGAALLDELLLRLLDLLGRCLRVERIQLRAQGGGSGCVDSGGGGFLRVSCRRRTRCRGLLGRCGSSSGLAGCADCFVGEAGCGHQ
ncbi:hypothetical protein D9M68_900960 [compost metagenome]